MKMAHLLIVPAAALVQAAAPPAVGVSRPPILQRLIDCRSVPDREARLACYDREVGGFEQAEARQDVVVVDRSQVRSARRSLFGIAIPNLEIFTGKDDQEAGLDKIEAKLTAVSRNAAGKWIFTLDDKARWIQIDSRELQIDPRAGQPIAIRKAAMGSYFANVNGQIAVRVKRLL